MIDVTALRCKAMQLLINEVLSTDSSRLERVGLYQRVVSDLLNLGIIFRIGDEAIVRILQSLEPNLTFILLSGVAWNVYKSRLPQLGYLPYLLFSSTSEIAPQISYALYSSGRKIQRLTLMAVSLRAVQMKTPEFHDCERVPCLLAPWQWPLLTRVFTAKQYFRNVSNCS